MPPLARDGDNTRFDRALQDVIILGVGLWDNMNWTRYSQNFFEPVLDFYQDPAEAVRSAVRRLASVCPAAMCVTHV